MKIGPITEDFEIVPFFFRTVPKAGKPNHWNDDCSSVDKINAQRVIADAHRLSACFLYINAQRTHTTSPRDAHGALGPVS